MRLHRILCPKCKTALTSKAGIPEGQQLNCPKCKARFTAEAPVDAVEVVDDADVVEDDFEVVDDDEPPPPKKKPAAPAKAEKRHSADEDEDEVPRRKRKKDEDDEDDEAPRSRRRAHDDDEDDEDDDDRPRKRKKGGKQKGGYAKLKENVWVRVGTLTVLLAVLGVLVFLFIEKRKKDREAEEYNQGHAQQERDYSQPIDPVRAAAEKKALEQRRNMMNRLAGRWKIAEGEEPVPRMFEEINLTSTGSFQHWMVLDGKRVEANGNWFAQDPRGDTTELLLEITRGGQQIFRVTLRAGDKEMYLEYSRNEKGIRFTRAS